MAECKILMFGFLLFGLASIEANSRHRRQAWRNVAQFHVSDGKPVNNNPPAPAHAPPPPPAPPGNHPPPPPPGSNPFGQNWNLLGALTGMSTGQGTSGSGGNTQPSHTSQNHWNHPPPPPPPARQNQHLPPPPQNWMPPPPPPPQNWNHPPPPPPQNMWNHPPPQQHNWHPPPPPPPQNNPPQSQSTGNNLAGAIGKALQQQMQMQMMHGVDLPDSKKRFNPAPVEVLKYGCPPELPITQCVVNPCPLRCKRYPMAKCYTNPCGNCSPEWLQNGMKIIDCD